jgi:hypothetical protein
MEKIANKQYAPMLPKKDHRHVRELSASAIETSDTCLRNFGGLRACGLDPDFLFDADAMTGEVKKFFGAVTPVSE